MLSWAARTRHLDKEFPNAPGAARSSVATASPTKPAEKENDCSILKGQGEIIQ